MTSRKLRFAIVGNTYQAKKSASVQKILNCLAMHEAEVCMEREFHRFLVHGQHLSLDGVEVFDGNDFEADFTVSMGGDGTFLKTASMVGEKQIPIIGVNTGRLGFLADINPPEIDPMVQAIYEGDYAIDTRTVLQVETDGQPLAGCPFALNDVAILKRDVAAMITVRTTINGDYVTTYQADGLVISTPTGSTAYSLSVGGPIIVPGTHVFSITAVAPHSLNVRPLVLSEDSEITLTVESRSHNFLVALDGRSEKLPDSTRLTLRKAPYRVKVVKRAGQKYFHTLRDKMMWGADQRG
ncbi:MULTISPECIES: NAD kinase [unclassified Prevotella]|uniref:NAD kinase n=1 Tax=unclassified Prevotella TaxID=2638335 RepID=UPI000B9612BA|nr:MULTISPECIES: NAD kinase [unclassified Prevotella]OYP42136.1 NAD kinase [Prevotella sp. P5-50]OYP43236.1 NAD kinase [Prevotella sp. P4-119]